MSAPAILDLNDTNLQLWHGGPALQSPGYALLDGRQYTFGGAARNAARLRPRDINTRYWWQLNTEKLQPALGPARHTADLVHSHLLDIHQRGGKPEEIILAVPSSMARDQLALLLGIIGQCPFNAVGLVNRSVLLASGHSADNPLSGSVYHLEIQLHQAVISELGHTQGQLELRQTVPLPGCGLLQVQERLVELVASAFVRQTRFDPRRKAESEQQLYDALPGVLQTLNINPEANVEVMGYRARINRAELRSAGERLFTSAAEGMGIVQADDQIIIDPVAGLLPGLMGAFPHATLIQSETLPVAIEQHRELLTGGNNNPEENTLPFITTLPCTVSSVVEETPDTAAQAPPTVAPAQPEGRTATHILINAVASILNPAGTKLANGCELFALHDAWQIRGDSQCTVNGKAYQPGQALYCGDRIDCRKGSANAQPVTALLIAIDKP